MGPIKKNSIFTASLTSNIDAASLNVGHLTNEMARIDTRVNRHEDKLDAMRKMHEDQMVQLQDKVEYGNTRGNTNTKGPLIRAELHEQA